MGTDIIKERNLYAALQNCAFVSTDDIDKKLTRPFEFMFEMSMLGVGVGFDTKGANKVKINQPLTDNVYTFSISDSHIIHANTEA